MFRELGHSQRDTPALACQDVSAVRPLPEDTVADVTGPLCSLSSLLSAQNPGAWIHVDLGL